MRTNAAYRDSWLLRVDSRNLRASSTDHQELLALALILKVPPVLLLAPLDADETLQITPNTQKDALDAAAWIADDDAVFGPLRIAREHERSADGAISRWVNSNPLTLLRQIRMLGLAIRARDHALQQETLRGGKPSAANLNALTVYGMRLRERDFTGWLAGLGYTPPEMPRAEKILQRWERSVPASEVPLDKLFDPAVDAWQGRQEVPDSQDPRT